MKTEVALLLTSLVLVACLAGCGRDATVDRGAEALGIESGIAFLDALAAATEAKKLSWVEAEDRPGSDGYSNNVRWKSYLPDETVVVVEFYQATQSVRYIQWSDGKLRDIASWEVYEASVHDNEVRREMRHRVNEAARRVGTAVCSVVRVNTLETATAMLLKLAGNAEKAS